MDKQPKYKREIRVQIIQNINLIKNVYALRQLLELSDIMLKSTDDKLYESMTDREWRLIALIDDVMLLDAGALNRLHASARVMAAGQYGRKKLKLPV